MALLETLARWLRPEPIASVPELQAFMDSRAAFIAQKCVVEYARARTGVLSTKLFKEAAFKEALTRSRWTTYTIAYCDVSEMVEGLLRSRVRLSRTELAQRLLDWGQAAFLAHGLPEGAPPDFWARAIERLERRLAEARLHAPKPVREIPKTDMDEVFANLPIHESLRGHDYELVQNNLRTNLVRVHEDFLAAVDFDRLVRSIDSG
jgi:hypothetical protein